MKELKADMKALRADVSEIKGQLKAMPTTGQIIGTNIGLAVAIAGLVFAVARAMR